MTLTQDRAAHDPSVEPNFEIPRVLNRGIAVQRTGRQGRVEVTGELDGITRRHLDDLLDWLITDGTTQITVTLVTAEEIDRASIVILQVAHARLRNREGQLLVIAPAAAAQAASTGSPGSAGIAYPNRRRTFAAHGAGQRLPTFPILTSECREP